LAERFADELATHSISGAGLILWYARLLGASIGRDAELHSLPPVTGHLSLGRGASIDPEVDLTGHWIDGATLHLGTITVGKGARIGARSTLAPNCVIGDGAEIAAGSAVFGTVPAGQLWSGAPAHRAGGKPGTWHKEAATSRPQWRVAYAVSGLVLAALPILAALVGVLATSGALRHTSSLSDLAGAVVRWLPVGTLAGFATLALLVLALTRLVGASVREGRHAVHSRPAWAAWTTIRLLDDARTWLFPIYSSTLTPAWLRALGARIGADVEASTVLLIPRLTWVNDGAFLADDTLLGGYELGGGWLRTQRVKVGKHAFLGNSGMTAPGRRIRKGSLVAVLSAAPAGRAGKAGTSWLGSPPEQLRRTTVSADTARTFAPPRRLRVARGVVEVLRFVPVTMGIGLYAVAAGAMLALAERSWWLAALLGGLILMAVGMVAAECLGGRQVAARRAAPGRELSAVEFVRLAQRARRHLRRGHGGALVCPGDDWDAGPQPVAARQWRNDRPRRLVRHLLVARGRPRDTRRWGDSQPRLRSADPPFPRPGSVDGPGHLWGRRDTRTQRSCVASRRDWSPRHRWTRLPCHARRGRPRTLAVDRQPHRAVARHTGWRSLRSRPLWCR
jgi:non-ribosomal peptide synthetase-like protein